LFPALVLAGLSCCVAMSMPQVHMVAYCADLGVRPGAGHRDAVDHAGLRGARRLVSGLIADKVGGLPTLLAGSFLQMIALLAYIPFDGLASLYVVSAVFGLSRAASCRAHAHHPRPFPAREAGSRISTVLTATVFGVRCWAAGCAGEIYDWTGTYTMAFLNGVAWNVLNLGDRPVDPLRPPARHRRSRRPHWPDHARRAR
jgi:hypothetical protein